MQLAADSRESRLMALLLRPYVHGLVVDYAVLIDASTNVSVDPHESRSWWRWRTCLRGCRGFATAQAGEALTHDAEW